MTNEEKAAILLLSFGEDVAAKVMSNLRPSEIRRLSKYMSRISSIPGDTLNSVAREFCTLSKEQGGLIAIDEDSTKNIVTKALGEKSADELLQDVASGASGDNPIIEKVRDMDPKVLMDFTKTEHPQTIALILAHLSSEQAAQILDNYSPEMQYEITRRMATLKSVPQEFLEVIAKTLENEIVVGVTAGQEIGGVRMIAEVLNKMGRSSENAIMLALEDAEPELAAAIRNLMFTFDDILKLDDRSLQEILREVKSEDLARAMKLVEEGLREKFYKNMSKRGAEMLREDIEMMPPTRLSEVEASQRTIIEIAKHLEAEGRIMISRSDSAEDAFV
ncbi:MAG: flagellar motor switch protein FliG [Syntrophales bacterium]